jgi:anti-sigma factor RsiW
MLLFTQTNCTRARESVSARLDGELPELELERLEAHLRACPACSLWAEQAEDTTSRLRQARLEVPGRSVALPRRGRTRTGALALAAASAAAAIAAVVAIHAPQAGSPGPQAAPVLSQRASNRAHSLILASLHGLGGGPIGGLQVSSAQRGHFRAL